MSLSPDLPLDTYRLEDSYTRQQGRVYLTGTQALVRIALSQARMDRRNGAHTSGFISGYRGSPLGGFDQALWRAQTHLKDNKIEFMPAINEDLAATAVLGTQQVETDPAKKVDGVFSIWYGKGPGVDRSGDALKHGNAYGSSPHGGVLVVAGDDHGCVSSSMSHQSDVAFMAWFMPTLNPASVAEYLEFGLYGIALSRFSGMWVGFKAISETVESAASVDLKPLPDFQTPLDFEPPPGGLHYRWPDFPGPQIEERMVAKVEAVKAFARANPIDRVIYDLPNAHFGFITTGKAHHDLMEALRLLGLDRTRAASIGIDVYKVGLVWPIETEGLRRFLADKHEVLVVEEKRGIIESQLKEFLYDYSGAKPRRMVGKYDDKGAPLIPWTGELSPSLLAPIIARRLEAVFPDLSFENHLDRIARTNTYSLAPGGVRRAPYFCSGCPHNTSTKVPQGSRALAGIGCHFMASWMNRDTDSLIQMGGEGVNWAAKSKFTGHGHIFQNLGEGTYFHSGSMAIRQAIAAGANITYKILFNDAVAMTGGQPVDGAITVAGIAHQTWAEGAKHIAIVSDDIKKYRNAKSFPPGVTLHHRDKLDAVQKRLRAVKGVTILIYDQICATEKRRKTKRGTYPKPTQHVFINDLVCEGCGDCSDQSNCLSVVPLETEFGRKRRIDPFSCNTDYACLNGFCPSFVTVTGGHLKAAPALNGTPEIERRMHALALPKYADLTTPYNLLVGGVGGTGVITLGALITMAAHLEGKGASVLDFMGFAQKGGTVISYIRLGRHPDALNQVRIDRGMADGALVCDMVVGTDQKFLDALRDGHTKLVVNSAEIPTADFVLDPDADMQAGGRLDLLRRVDENLTVIEANRLMEHLMGDSVFTNIFLLGLAWQRGLVPVSLPALNRAIELNDVAVEKNKLAFTWGRLAAQDPVFVCQTAQPDETPPAPDNLDTMIERRCTFLTGYQNAQYAERYLDLVNLTRAAEGAETADLRLTQAVALYYFKLLAYKDEYEVARLYTDGSFQKKVNKAFDGDFKIHFHMAPPFLGGKKDAQGRPVKRAFGPWMLPILHALARLRFLRGTLFDPFGHTAERKIERTLISEYEKDIKALIPALTEDNLSDAVKIAEMPAQIRGFGPVKQESALKAQTRTRQMMARLV